MLRQKWLILTLVAALAAAGGLSYGYYAYHPVIAEVISTKPVLPAKVAAKPAATGVPVVPLNGGQIVKPTDGTVSDGWTFNALGDVIIGRDVYLKVQQRGVNYPFEKMADQTRSADLTIADQEGAISDSHTIICSTCMQFASPDRVADGLTFAGIDAMSVANNHSFNAGGDAFVDTLNALDKRGIKYFGGGHNFTEAHTPRIMTVKGVKVALLGYNTIVGGSDATETAAGMAQVGIAPWFPWNESQAQQMEADIRAASKMADVVIPVFHWGTEYTHLANDDQRQLAHRAIDAGATMVIGSHPHWVQGVEWYHNKLIAYSLANFVFDQEWSRQTKQGMYLKAQFSKNQLLSAELVPYRIDDYAQPHPTDSAESAEILNNVFSNSWWVK